MLEIPFFPICGLWSGKGPGDSIIFDWKWYSKEEESLRFLGLQGDCSLSPLLYSLPYWDMLIFPLQKFWWRCLVSLLYLFWKEWGEYFLSNRFTECKVIDEKEVTHSFMVFNLLKIGLFQKKPNTVGLGYTFLKHLPRFQTKKTSSLETQHDCIIPLENFKA